MKVKVIGQRSRSNVKKYFPTTVLPCSRSKVRVMVKGWGQSRGQGQISGVQRSILGALLCRVRQRAKKSHYQYKVFVCVSNNCVDAINQLFI